ncbi:hypothetical protein BIV57_10055 [Mangrovactinospora gilvigrisea]|uniref:Uncharacterized protein n=1 Tax=Mangrovactinospora gilvigrisea TaxID=1428644 RepID=A0A1J7C7Y4_9ACTN|nr:DUF6297 family protein [Mangrovactinospora gilvigrisea]OIV37636.1 hypothetical protein BIV57_10055 [Mangrovactinospora gilvigrisea]
MSGWGPEDDRTPVALAWLRIKRRAHRAQRNRDLGFILYAVVLIGIGWGSTVVYRTVHGLVLNSLHGNLGPALLRTLPAGLVLIGAALALLAARDGLWRGPVVVPGPTVSWLLGQPVDRARVLRPWFRNNALAGAVVGALCALGGAVLLAYVHLASFGVAFAALLAPGLGLPLLAAALGAAVERRPRLASLVRRLSPFAALALVAVAAQTVFAWLGHPVRVLERIELWSGPWGWAAQPVIRASGGSAPGWWAALALLAAASAWALWQAWRDAAAVPNAALRARAATASTVASVGWSVELRAARLAVAQATAGDGRRRLPRLPMPKRRALLVPWRDATALLRAPGRVGRAVLWTAAGAAAAGWATALPGAERGLMLVAALVLGYVGVATLAESARVETDDLRRAAWSPFRMSSLMLRHTVVPALAGAVLGALEAIPFALRGGEARWALLVMPLCAVPFAVAAVYGACRGPVRSDRMILGAPTPAGDPGIFVFLAWYWAAPLISVTVLTVTLLFVIAGSSPLNVIAPAVALTALLLALVRWQAGRLLKR